MSKIFDKKILVANSCWDVNDLNHISKYFEKLGIEKNKIPKTSEGLLLFIRTKFPGLNDEEIMMKLHAFGYENKLDGFKLNVSELDISNLVTFFVIMMNMKYNLDIIILKYDINEELFLKEISNKSIGFIELENNIEYPDIYKKYLYNKHLYDDKNIIDILDIIMKNIKIDIKIMYFPDFYVYDSYNDAILICDINNKILLLYGSNKQSETIHDIISKSFSNNGKISKKNGWRYFKYKNEIGTEYSRILCLRYIYYIAKGISNLEYIKNIKKISSYDVDKFEKYIITNRNMSK